MNERCERCMLGTRGLQEEARQTWDYAFSDEAVYLPKVGYAVSGKGQAYADGNAWIELLLKVVADRHVGYYIATFERALEIADEPREGGHLDLGLKLAGRSMLKPITELVQKPEQFFQRIVSVVRLKRFDNIPKFVGEVSDCVGEPLARSIIGRASIEDGEEMSACDGLPHRLTQPANEMIERPSHMVEGLIDYHVEGTVPWFDLIQPADVPSIVRAYFTDNAEWYRLLEEPQRNLKAIEVVFCPVEFETCPAWWHHGVSHDRRPEADDPEGRGDPSPHSRAGDAGSPQSLEAEGLNYRPTGEVGTGTSRARNAARYSAKRTHSGSPEDA